MHERVELGQIALSASPGVPVQLDNHTKPASRGIRDGESIAVGELVHLIVPAHQDGGLRGPVGADQQLGSFIGGDVMGCARVDHWSIVREIPGDR